MSSRLAPRATQAFLLSLVGLLAVCSDAGREEVAVVDVGEYCLPGVALGTQSDSGTAEVEFPANAPLQLYVGLDPCLSGCAADVAATCEVIQTGMQLQIHARGTYTYPTSDDVDCPTICVPMTAKCSTPALAPGSYTVSYRGASVALTVPGKGSALESSPGRTCRMLNAI